MRQFMFIVIDGMNGSGKSGAIEIIKNHIIEMTGKSVVLTREPGGTLLGEKVRNLVLSNDNNCMSDISELLLFSASRAQNVSEVIKPALEADKVVISDRFISSSIAFQGYARGLPLDTIKKVSDIALDGLSDYYTIILDIAPEIGLERIAKDKRTESDRIEHEAIDFQNKARMGYLKQAEENPDYFFVINTDRPYPDVKNEIKETLDVIIKREEVKNAK